MLLYLYIITQRLRITVNIIGYYSDGIHSVQVDMLYDNIVYLVLK